jgi:hypothetical protein
MGFIAGAIIGSSIIGGIGGMMAGKSSARAQRYAADTQAESFRFHRPYLEQNYDGAQAALGNSIDAGTYQGQTYADMNPYTEAGFNYIGNMGMLNGQNAYDMSQTGAQFGSNYNDLYNSSTQGDRMGVAQNYASENINPLMQGAMRDDLRNLQENQMTGINLNASNSGNANSSRAGVAEAVAQRGYDDRYSDTYADINNQLVNQSLGQQNQQFKDSLASNKGLQQAYMRGIDGMGTSADWMIGGGQGFSNYAQGGMDDAQSRFNSARDYELDQRIKYQQGILGQAETQSPQNPVMQTASAGAGAFGGAMAGAGMGLDIAKFLKT